jgi:hypothetical protein
MVAEFPFPGQHSFSTHDNREPIARQLLSVLVIQTTDISLSSEWLMADRRPIVANYLATNRKPKSVANLLPIFYLRTFVFVRLW